MTHRYNIRKTQHDSSTGLITKITFSLVTEEGDNYWHVKHEFNLTGSPSDAGFIAFNDLTQADLEGFIDTYLTKSTIESSNSASLATHVESLVYSDDLPPNLQ
jgi:hypothetical protein